MGHNILIADSYHEYHDPDKRSCTSRWRSRRA